MKRIFFLVVTGLLVSGIAMKGFSQEEKKKKTEEVEILTSAVCDMCKERIEHDLAFEKGIRYVELDLETKIVTVKYNPRKTNPEKIREAISKIGYDADDIEADPKAYEKLPMCCKKDAPPH